jgi:diguanylate cyclase (GGDEF)-like protein/PAS domain S-box-containing protein
VGIDRKKILSLHELRLRAEERLKALASKMRPSSSREETRRRLRDLQIHQIELETQKEEIRQSRDRLALSRDRWYAELYEFSPVGYLTFDGQGLIRDTNLAGAQLLGLDRSLLLDKSFSRFIADPEGRERFCHHLKEVLQHPGMQGCEIRLKGKDGPEKYGLLRSIALETTTSREAYVLSSIVDATTGRLLGEALQQAKDQLEVQVQVRTADLLRVRAQLSREVAERRQTEEALEESEARYRALFEKSTEGMVITEVETRRFLRANAAFCRMLGYSLEDISDLGVEHIHPAASLAKFYGDFSALAGGRNALAVDIPCLRKDGTLLYADIAGSPMRIDGKRCLVEHFIDVTERKQLQDALRTSEGRFKQVAESAGEWIWEVDAEGLYTYSSPAVEQILGYTPDEIVGRMHFYETFAPDERATLKEAAFHAIAKKSALRGFVTLNLHKNGQRVILETNGVPNLDEQGQLLGYRGADTDITGRELLAEAARRREEEFKAIADYTYDWESWIAPDGSLLWVNPAVEKFTGYSSGECLRKPHFLARIILREDRVQIRELLEKGLKERLSGNHIPFRIRHRDGRILWVAISYQPIYANDGAFLGMRHSVRDISESKHIEAQVLGLATLKESLLGGETLDEKLTLVTDGMVAIFGAEFARIWLVRAGDRCAQGCLHAQVEEGPEVCRNHARCLHLVASSGRFTAIDGSHRRVPLGCYMIGLVAAGEESRVITNDVAQDPRIHDPEWARALNLVSFAGFRLVSAAGEPIGVMALFSRQAITPVAEGLLANLANFVSQEIMADQAREAVRKSEAKYRTLYEHANDAILLLQEDIIIDCNSRALQMFQCSREQIVGRSPLFFSPSRQPDGRDSEEKALEKDSAVLAGIPQSFEWQHCRFDRTPFDVEISLIAVEVDHERLVQAIIRDVTERKLLQEELYQQSVVDELTGLYNRRGFLTLSDQQLKVAQRNHQRLFLFFIDLDDLKWVNDHLGHQEGDAILVESAAILRRTFRQSDIIGRMGGDEFAILEIGTDTEARNSIARLQAALKDCNRSTARKYQLSLSLGSAAFDPEKPCSLDELIATADNRMYEEKSTKRRPRRELS